MTRLGYQIPNFTYPGVATADIFANVVAQARAAEAAGFDRLFVMDHFYQLPTLGEPDEAMMECYTLLGALAQHCGLSVSAATLTAVIQGNVRPELNREAGSGPSPSLTLELRFLGS